MEKSYYYDDPKCQSFHQHKADFMTSVIGKVKTCQSFGVSSRDVTTKRPLWR